MDIMNTAESYKLLENIFVLKKSTLFSSVNTNELRAVAAIVEELSFRKSSTIVREGDIGDCLYLIKRKGADHKKSVCMERLFLQSLQMVSVSARWLQLMRK